jgi:hypothetical protein
MKVYRRILGPVYGFEKENWRILTRKDKIRKIRNNVIKEKMNVTRSLLDDVKMKQLQLYGQSKGWRRGDVSKGVLEWRPSGGRKRGRPRANLDLGSLGSCLGR